MKKLLLSIFFVFLTISGATGSPAHAQDSTEYELLAPIPYVDGSAPGFVSSKSYIEGSVKLIIALAIVLSIVTIIFGGLKYMSTDAFSGKEEGKKIIQNAFWGLGLALGAWMIIYTISPGLVNLNLSIETFIPPPTATTTTPLGSDCTTPSCGNPWPPNGADETVERANLSAVGVSVTGQITSLPCTTIGERGCTSVFGLKTTTISQLGNLKTACNCNVTITGGTEYWNHGNFQGDGNNTQHNPNNGRVVDIRMTPGLDTYIISNGTRLTGRNSCSNLGSAYTINNAVYVNENSHWHVCY